MAETLGWRKLKSRVVLYAKQQNDGEENEEQKKTGASDKSFPLLHEVGNSITWGL